MNWIYPYGVVWILVLVLVAAAVWWLSKLKRRQANAKDPEAVKNGGKRHVKS